MKTPPPVTTTPERIRLLAVERGEIALIRALAPFLQSRAGKALGAIGNLGDKPPLLLLSGAVLASGLAFRDPKLARTGLSMIGSHAVTVAIVGFGKSRIDRSRPRQLLKDASYERHLGRSHSPRLRAFPSGHSAGSMAVARAFGRSYPRFARLAGTVAGAVGALQLPRRGAHWPTDIAAGALIGVAADIATHAAQGGLKRLLRGPSAK